MYDSIFFPNISESVRYSVPECYCFQKPIAFCRFNSSLSPRLKNRLKKKNFSVHPKGPTKARRQGVSRLVYNFRFKNISITQRRQWMTRLPLTSADKTFTLKFLDMSGWSISSRRRKMTSAEMYHRDYEIINSVDVFFTNIMKCINSLIYLHIQCLLIFRNKLVFAGFKIRLKSQFLHEAIFLYYVGAVLERKLK